MQRRSLTKQQLAVVAAEAWDLAELGTHDDNRRGNKLSRDFGVNHRYVAMASALVTRAPDAAREVKEGRASLHGAYDALMAADREAKAREQQRADLEAERERLDEQIADLAGQAGSLPLLPPPTPQKLAFDRDVLLRMTRPEGESVVDDDTTRARPESSR